MKKLLLLLTLSAFVSCKKDDDAAAPVERATLKLIVTSNYKYPEVFLQKDMVQIAVINATPNTQVPITASYELSHGEYEVFCWAVRDSMHPMNNMLDSSAAWIHVVAVLDGDTVANKWGGPMVDEPWTSMVNANFQY